MRLELTRRGDYAVRAMLALSQLPPGDGPLSARRIAGRMSIPAAFVTQVMADLVAAGLVAATSGRSGGYRLARPAAAISVLEVIESVEGDGRRIVCVLRGIPCGSDGFCDAHQVFFAAQEAMLDQLRRATLAELGRRDGGTTPALLESTPAPKLTPKPTRQPTRKPMPGPNAH